MLRRSTSFDTSPMPMKIAMNRPNTAVAASPRSLMILTSCPAVSWPMRYDEEISRTANSARLYGTRSRTDSLKTLTATQLIARMPSVLARPALWLAARIFRRKHLTVRRRRGAGSRALSHFRNPANEEILERVAQRVEGDQRRAARYGVREDSVGGHVHRELERIPVRRDLGALADLRGQSLEHFGPQVGNDELPAAHLKGKDVGQRARGRQPSAGDDRDT